MKGTEEEEQREGGRGRGRKGDEDRELKSFFKAA